MNPGHVSVEGQEARTVFPAIEPTFRLPVSPFWTPSQSVSEESQERRGKQKIIDRALQKITERGLCGLEPVKAYLAELYRRDCRPNVLRTILRFYTPSMVQQTRGHTLALLSESWLAL